MWRIYWRRKRRKGGGAVCETWAPGRDRRRVPRPRGTPWRVYRTGDRRPPGTPPPLPARAANWWRCAAGNRPDERWRRAQDRDRKAAGQSVSGAWFPRTSSVSWGQTLGQTASFRQTAPGNLVSVALGGSTSSGGMKKGRGMARLARRGQTGHRQPLL